jgi:hypothetical protein
LAACRAVICAALWPDPDDEHCPQSFRDAAARHLIAFAKRVNPEQITGEKQQLQATLSPEGQARWEVLARNDPPLDPADPAHQNVLRFALLDFIADFANWDSSTVAPIWRRAGRSRRQPTKRSAASRVRGHCSSIPSPAAAASRWKPSASAPTPSPAT